MLVVPLVLWERLLSEFARQPEGVERIAYFDGICAGSIAVVTTLVIPKALCDVGYYNVDAAAMSEAGQHLRAFGLRRLAQVHTHGHEWTGHSPRDDRMAYSQLDGAISIVVPFHARFRPAIRDCGVHVRCTDGWQRINRTALHRYVRVVPGVLDFRHV